MIAEVLDGETFVFPRPPPRCLLAMWRLKGLLRRPLRKPPDGPGGWLILLEPELHLHGDIVVPDVAGWRIDRMPRLPQAYFRMAPDWVCEVMSPMTRRIDRQRKLPIYAKNAVSHVWLVEPVDRMLEVLQLHREHWLLRRTAVDDQRVRAEPFDAIELPLGLLWETAVPALADPAHAS